MAEKENEKMNEKPNEKTKPTLTVGGENVGSSFTNLPIGQLICTPFIEIAEGQMALCEVYVKTLFQLAFEDSGSAKFGSDAEANKTRTLKFTYKRPVIDEVTGAMSTPEFEINAPLLALVPIPAFTMSDATVTFDMEVNIATSENSSTTEELDANVNFSFWGIKGNISGKVSHNDTSSFSKSQKATYTINARAIQQPAAEGMSKLTALLAETMEPIQMGS